MFFTIPNLSRSSSYEDLPNQINPLRRRAESFSDIATLSIPDLVDEPHYRPLNRSGSYDNLPSQINPLRRRAESFSNEAHVIDITPCLLCENNEPVTRSVRSTSNCSGRQSLVASWCAILALLVFAAYKTVN